MLVNLMDADAVSEVQSTRHSPPGDDDDDDLEILVNPAKRLRKM